ncbi:MAG: pentapeptide repeat-containing protein, partial [Candidatus Electrothrix sp.]
MANRKQLKILRQGIAAWNAWREDNPDAKIDLRGAKRDGWDLSGANFRQADIRGVSFRGTELVRVDFTEILAGKGAFYKICQACQALNIRLIFFVASYLVLICLLKRQVFDVGSFSFFEVILFLLLGKLFLEFLDSNWSYTRFDESN